MNSTEEYERKYYGKNYDYVMKNIKEDVELEKKYFKKKYPYADMSKFTFEADFDKNAVFQGYHIWFKNNSFLSTDITSDTFKNDPNMTKYLTINKPVENFPKI